MGKEDSLRDEILTCDKNSPFVFISYKRSDAENVYKIVIDLQKKGVNIWIDKELKKHAGKDWQKPAFDAIDNPNCKLILFFVSPNSLSSPAVLAELLYAKEDEVKFSHDDVPVPIIGYDLEGFYSKDSTPKRYIQNNKEVLKNVKYVPNQLKDTFVKIEDAEVICESITDGFKLGFRLLKAADLYTEKNTLALNIEDIFATLEEDYKEVIGIKNEIKEVTGVTEEKTVTTSVETKVNDVLDNDTNIKSENVIDNTSFSYRLSDMLKNLSDKTFKAADIDTIAMSIEGKPEYTIEPCKNTSQLMKNYVAKCLEINGEEYINRINRTNKNQSNPVFARQEDVKAKKYGNTQYSKLKDYPQWALNVNYSVYGCLNELGKRLKDEGIALDKVTIYLERELSFSDQEPKKNKTAKEDRNAEEKSIVEEKKPDNSVFASRVSYKLSDVLKNYSNKTFRASDVASIGMSINGKSDYTIESSKNTSQLLKAFVGICLEKEGEAYIERVNKINESQTNPVFALVTDVEAKKYGNNQYSKLKDYPKWAINMNYSVFDCLKELGKRIEELNISLADVTIYLESELSEVAKVSGKKPVNTIDPETNKLNISGPRSLNSEGGDSTDVNESGTDILRKSALEKYAFPKGFTIESDKIHYSADKSKGLRVIAAKSKEKKTGGYWWYTVNQKYFDKLKECDEGYFLLVAGSVGNSFWIDSQVLFSHLKERKSGGPNMDIEIYEIDGKYQLKDGFDITEYKL